MPDNHDPPTSVTGKAIPDGRLELTFQQDPEGRSYLSKQYYCYPFHVCRAQYMDKALPELATLYLQSCSGGVFRGDRLTTKIHVMQNAWAHVTTQSSTIIHRMEQGSACHTIKIDGEAGALVEYLPDCTILFPEAKLRSSITITCHPDCDVIIGDSFLAHDPNDGGETFSWLENELIIRRPDGQIDMVDRFTVTGEQFRSGETSAVNEYAVHGTFAVISNRATDGALLDSLRGPLDNHPEIYAGASYLPNNSGCWVRYVASDGAAAKSFVTALWFKSREMLTGHLPGQRRK